jgi:hypothetical protein
MTGCPNGTYRNTLFHVSTAQVMLPMRFLPNLILNDRVLLAINVLNAIVENIVRSINRNMLTATVQNTEPPSADRGAYCRRCALLTNVSIPFSYY